MPWKRPALVVSFLLLLGMLTLVCPSQSSTPSQARRDATAVQYVTQALTAMGGATVWSGIADARVTGTCAAPQDQGGASANFLWVNAGKEFRLETDTADGGPVYLSAHGKPFLSASADNTGNVFLAPEYYGRMQPHHLPGLVLQRMLSDPRIGILYADNNLVNGSPAVHIRFHEEVDHFKVAGSDQDWWFDPTSGLPLRAEYRMPTQTNSIYAHLRFDYSGWSSAGNVLVPFQLVQSVAGKYTVQSCTISGVTFNAKPTSTIFEAR